MKLKSYWRGHDGEKVKNHWPKQCSWDVTIRRIGSTFRAWRISQLRPSSPSVTTWTHRKNSISAPCTWDSILCHYPRLMTIGEDRKKTDFKDWQLSGVRKFLLEALATILWNACPNFYYLAGRSWAALLKNNAISMNRLANSHTQLAYFRLAWSCCINSVLMKIGECIDYKKVIC